MVYAKIPPKLQDLTVHHAVHKQVKTVTCYAVNIVAVVEKITSGVGILVNTPSSLFLF